MSAEQVLRALILRMRFDYSYRQLADATADSLCVREFLKIMPYEKGWNYKTLQSNIKLLKENTLDLLHKAIKSFAYSSALEDGTEIRTDGFATQSNIHYPTDWSLMNDSIRVLSRILTRAYEDLRVPLSFTNHYRASKKKLFKIHFRNVSAPLPEGFVETFLDHGYVDMTQVMRTLHESGYTGAVISDHNPHMVGGRLTAEAFALGYMRGLIQTISGV